MARHPYVESAHDRERKARAWLDEPGYYAIRKIKGGPEVAAVVVYRPTPDPWHPENQMDRPHYWELWVNGSLYRGPNKEKEASNVAFTTSGRRITEEEYDYLLKDREWARAHAPHLPEARPEKPVDLNTVPISSIF